VDASHRAAVDPTSRSRSSLSAGRRHVNHDMTRCGVAAGVSPGQADPGERERISSFV
jgi:hypothetical protein